MTGSPTSVSHQSYPLKSINVCINFLLDLLTLADLDLEQLND